MSAASFIHRMGGNSKVEDAPIPVDPGLMQDEPQPAPAPVRSKSDPDGERAQLAIAIKNRFETLRRACVEGNLGLDLVVKGDGKIVGNVIALAEEKGDLQLLVVAQIAVCNTKRIWFGE